MPFGLEDATLHEHVSFFFFASAKLKKQTACRANWGIICSFISRSWPTKSVDFWRILSSARISATVAKQLFIVSLSGGRNGALERLRRQTMLHFFCTVLRLLPFIYLPLFLPLFISITSLLFLLWRPPLCFLRCPSHSKATRAIVWHGLKAIRPRWLICAKGACGFFRRDKSRWRKSTTVSLRSKLHFL